MQIHRGLQLHWSLTSIKLRPLPLFVHTDTKDIINTVTYFTSVSEEVEMWIHFKWYSRIKKMLWGTPYIFADENLNIHGKSAWGG